MGHDTSITISHNLIYAIAQHAIQGGNDSVGNDPFASSLAVSRVKRNRGVNEWKLRLSKRLRAYVRRPRMANEMHG
jgi:hypothetical protein